MPQKHFQKFIITQAALVLFKSGAESLAVPGLVFLRHIFKQPVQVPALAGCVYAMIACWFICLCNGSLYKISRFINKNKLQARL